MSREDALREARHHFGDIAAIEAECRDVRTVRAQENERREGARGLQMDLRYALRSLRNNIGFTVAAVLTLGLGVGAAAAVFSVVDGVLLRPLPYADASRLVMMWITTPSAQGLDSNLPLSTGLYLEARDNLKNLTPTAAFRSWPFVLGATDANTEPEQVPGSRTEATLFETLGVKPLLGRTYSAAEAVAGGPKVAVISYALWQRRFGGARDVVDGWFRSVANATRSSASCHAGSPSRVGPSCQLACSSVRGQTSGHRSCSATPIEPTTER
jgi:hypothetical protein